MLSPNFPALSSLYCLYVFSSQKLILAVLINSVKHTAKASELAQNLICINSSTNPYLHS